MSELPNTLTAKEHFNELRGLLAKLDTARFAPDVFRGDLTELHDRLAHHCTGLLADEETCLPLIESAIGSGDARSVAAAVYFLLHTQHEKAADLVIKTLLETQDPATLDAVGKTLVSSPIDGLPLELLLDVASPEVASVILLAFAAHGQADAYDEDRVRSLLQSDSPHVRARGWQIASIVGD